MDPSAPGTDRDVDRAGALAARVQGWAECGQLVLSENSMRTHTDELVLVDQSAQSIMSANPT